MPVRSRSPALCLAAGHRPRATLRRTRFDPSGGLSRALSGARPRRKQPGDPGCSMPSTHTCLCGVQMTRRDYGSVRRLRSGRWQARYATPAGGRTTVPETFPTRASAAAYLAKTQTDVDRGSWLDPVAAPRHRRVRDHVAGGPGRPAASDDQRWPRRTGCSRPS